MPRVVTVLCHGTNFHRHKTGELVAEFGRRLAGSEIVAGGIGRGDPLRGDYIINEGPGSDSGRADAATPGTVNPLLETRKGEIARLVDETRIAREAARDIAALNAAVRARQPRYDTIAEMAAYEARRLALPRSAGEAYAAYVRGFASVLAAPLQSPDLYLPSILQHLDPGPASRRLATSRTGFALDFYGEGVRTPFAIEGSATGVGWDDNVHKTVGRIANLEELPDVVNLLGWSRGGITCLKIANKLWELFPQIKVNIFAVDPVYGGVDGGRAFDVCNVPTSVEQLVVILSMHERRRTFRPQVESMLVLNPRTTRALFLPMPGSHDQQVERSGGPPAQVTWHLAFKLLAQWGTRFSSAPATLLSPTEVCRRYADMSLRMEWFKAHGTSGLGNFVIGMGFADRTLARDPSIPSPYFINLHHWLCFQGVFPNSARFFLNRERERSRGMVEELRHEDAVRRSIDHFFGVEAPRPNGVAAFLRSRL